MISRNIYKFLILVIVFFCSCKEKKDSVKINLTIKNSPANQIVSLVGKDYGQSPLLLDTASIALGNSNASFEMFASTAGIYSLNFGKDGRYILLSNDEPVINLSVDWNKFSDYSTSSQASETLKKLLVGFNDYLRAIDDIRKDSTQNQSDSIRAVKNEQIVEKRNETKQFLSHFTDTTKSAAVAVYALGILQQQQNDSTIMKPLIKRLVTRFPADETVTRLNNDYTAWLKKESNAITIGKAAPLFSLPDTAGQNISLQSLRGKYVLVDFWASWCAPCRQENPNVVKAFNAFKDKNFTVLGVSLDKNKQAWLDAIHKDGLIWQQVSDLKEWDSNVVPLYNIEGIPYNVLLDADGKIIAMNLRGDDLHKKLSEAVKPVATP